MRLFINYTLIKEVSAWRTAVDEFTAGRLVFSRGKAFEGDLIAPRVNNFNPHRSPRPR